jgi:hypothetical protein
MSIMPPELNTLLHRRLRTSAFRVTFYCLKQPVQTRRFLPGEYSQALAWASEKWSDRFRWEVCAEDQWVDDKLKSKFLITQENYRDLTYQAR